MPTLLRSLHLRVRVLSFVRRSQLGPQRGGNGKWSEWKRASTILLLVFATALASRAQTYSLLLSFTGSSVAGPAGPLVQGIDGNLYGAADNPFGSSVIYRLTPSGTLTALATVGNYLNVPGALVQTPSGNFYGTTTEGGPDVAGTVFMVTPSGTLTTLHNFSTQDTRGAFPGELLLGSNGNLYGFTAGGGTSGYGTIFEMTPEGSLHTVFTFDSSNGGAANALIQGYDGNFYGTTYLGGPGDYGTFFKLTPGGTVKTIHTFNNNDGAGPYGGLVQGTDGSFYGVTVWGGDLTCDPATGCGTVFKVTPTGVLTTLHNFEIVHGLNPYTPLIQGADGNFYGTTILGGTSNSGTLFQITPSGKLTSLHSFGGGIFDGVNPVAALVQDTNGYLYGTTPYGGQDNEGIVYVVSGSSLVPFVEALPVSGKVGATIEILGTNLAGTTGVSFNGTAAAFTLVSDTEITAVVPAGAITGILEVETPNGTLRSNVAFRVTL